MGYLAAVILTIFLIGLFVSSPGFRVFVGVVVALAIAGIGYAIHYQKQESEAREAARQVKSNLIPITNIFVEDPIAFDDSGPRYFKARIHNRDRQHTIDAIWLQLTYSDCIAPGNCVVVGQSDLELTSDIPPGQARDVSGYMMNWPHTAKGVVEWSYQLSRVIAK